jgi:tetratricopeptide (TPR) repeat protein
MTLKNVASLSCIALVNAACSAPPIIPSPQRSAIPYPVEVAVPRIRKSIPASRPRPPAYRPQVQTYSGNGATRVEDLDDREPMTAIRPSVHPSRAENNRMDEESNRLDPYATKTRTSSSPSSASRSSESESASAVMALMLRAKLDMLAGRSEVAIEKLERGLRIQPSNPDLWNKLAEANFQGGNSKQAIAMAKKSMTLTNSSNRRLLKSNWHLIAKANQKMGNMDAMKSAMRMESSL